MFVKFEHEIDKPQGGHQQFVAMLLDIAFRKAVKNRRYQVRCYTQRKLFVIVEGQKVP
jgi:hypothetical protein